MSKLITIYRGDNPKELVRIEQVLTKNGYNYDKTLYDGIVGPVTVGKLFNLMNGEWKDNPYFQRRYLKSEVFEIKVPQENELAAAEALRGLNLSQPITSISPSIFRTLLLITGSVLFILLIAAAVLASPSKRLF